MNRLNTAGILFALTLRLGLLNHKAVTGFMIRQEDLPNAKVSQLPPEAAFFPGLFSILCLPWANNPVILSLSYSLRHILEVIIILRISQACLRYAMDVSMNIKEYYRKNAGSYFYPDLRKYPRNDGYGISPRVYPAQMETQSFGTLQVNCVTQTGFRPIPDATVRISYTGDPTSTIEELTTDEVGRTEEIQLPTPPLEYSLDPEIFDQPYSEYTIDVTAPGFERVDVSGTQLLPDVTAIQPVEMVPLPEAERAEEVFVIPPHTLYGDYPPKIAESEIKPTAETGEIVLRNVVVPEFVIVHDGPPTDTSAANYYIRYRDYIKNVASSEIYATWPEATILANILAIMSFTLNRVFTEWYRNQGYNFTITSSTAFDHKWMRGRNIYDNIGLAVDQVFNNYLSRPNVRQPILTQYCDGRNVTCPGWMTLWQQGIIIKINIQKSFLFIKYHFFYYGFQGIVFYSVVNGIGNNNFINTLNWI